MKYNSTLPEYIDGHQCNTLVHQFQGWKSTEYIPEHMHPAICWSKSDPFIVEASQETKWPMPKFTGYGNRKFEQ
jgi:hypothetical protein